MKITKGMYGLPWAGLLANNLQEKRLMENDSQDYDDTCSNQSHFLAGDDFVIKPKGTQHAKYLLQMLRQYYDMSVDWLGNLFCEISLKWD